MNSANAYVTNVEVAALATVGDENYSYIRNMPSSAPSQNDDSVVVATVGGSMGDTTTVSNFNNNISTMTMSDRSTITNNHSESQNHVMNHYHDDTCETVTRANTTRNTDLVNQHHDKQEEANEVNIENVVYSTVQKLHTVIDRIIQQEILEPMMTIPVVPQQRLDEMMESQRQSTTLADQKHTEAFMNLQQVVQESQTQLQDVTQSIRNEARLRAELSDMTSQRNEAMGQMEEQKHKVSLLLEQLTDLKIKIARYQQDKMQSERHVQHLTMQQQNRHVDAGTPSTLVTPSNPTSATSDAEFYQRKYNESNQKIQSYQAMMIEKNRQIDELRYQVERNMNQQQYNMLQSGRQGFKQDRSSMSTQSTELSLTTSSKRQRM